MKKLIDDISEESADVAMKQFRASETEPMAEIVKKYSKMAYMLYQSEDIKDLLLHIMVSTEIKKFVDNSTKTDMNITLNNIGVGIAIGFEYAEYLHKVRVEIDEFEQELLSKHNPNSEL